MEEWRLVEEPKRKKEDGSVEVPDMDDSLVFPLTVCRDGKAVPVHGGNSFRKGDRVRFALFLERSEEARVNLRTNGWAGEGERSVSIGTIRGDG